MHEKILKITIVLLLSSKILGTYMYTIIFFIFAGKTLLFIWDICFMHNWSKKIFYKLGLTILMMIKPWALEADNHRKLSRVLFDEPSNLYMKGEC